MLIRLKEWQAIQPYFGKGEKVEIEAAAEYAISVNMEKLSDGLKAKLVTEVAKARK